MAILIVIDKPVDVGFYLVMIEMIVGCSCGRMGLKGAIIGAFPYATRSGAGELVPISFFA